MSKNQLGQEGSLYLRQHKDNPVHWYSWGEEAFNQAQKEKKLVFISIGYSTCHWCHIMEKESFKNQKIANYLNKNFISIKVDREELPDVDQFYMEYCLATMKRGGWPLSVFAISDKTPFFAGTYFPPFSNHYGVGFFNLLEQIVEVWAQKEEYVRKQAHHIIDQLERESFSKFQVKDEKMSEDQEANLYLKSCQWIYDTQFYGFSKEPKFPQPYILWGLLNVYVKTQKREAFTMVTNVLTAIRRGGIYDHIGEGLHRYSTDREWFLPHFEKMLYDQAGVLLVASRAYSIQKSLIFKELINGIIEYINQDLKQEDGAFYCAQDADSYEGKEKKEGAYYVWEQKELKEFLSEEEYTFFEKKFEIKAEGNVKDDVHQMFKGKNILKIKDSFDQENREALWLSIKKKLQKNRKKRSSPLIDNKVLTDWNALLSVALCRSGVVLSQKKWIKMAENILKMIKNKLYKKGRLYHRWVNNYVNIEAYLLDYSLVLWAVCEMFIVTQKKEYIKWAQQLIENIKTFKNEKGQWEVVQSRKRRIPVGQFDTRDGAMISTQSALLWALERYSQVCPHSVDQWIEELSRKSYENIKEDPLASASLRGGSFLKNAEQIVITSRQEGDKEIVLDYLAQDDKFKRSIIDLTNYDQEEVKRIWPHLHLLKKQEGQYFMCQKQSCSLPQKTLKEAIKRK